MSFQHYFVIHRCGVRNKPRLNLNLPKAPPPPQSVRQYLLFSFFLFLSFLLSYFLIFFWGEGVNSLGGKTLSVPPPPPTPRSPSSLFSFLLPLLSFSFSPLFLSLLFLSSLSFFFFFFFCGGGAKARSPPPLDPRLASIAPADMARQASTRTVSNGTASRPIPTADGGTALRAESVMIGLLIEREILHANLSPISLV